MATSYPTSHHLIRLAIALGLFGNITTRSVLAQVTPANDGTGTTVNQNGNQFNIQGGSLSGDGANLFHSLEKLGLNRDQIANFMANPQVRNILTRVVGGEASIINGLIQVSGGNANLYLMNPAGVIFGPNAHINVAGDFVVTTATGIGFGNNQWFNAVGRNDYQTLLGNPSQFAFDLANPGVIFNAGNLTVGEGQNVSLLGGTVINTGTISAPDGDITIAAVPGTSRVKIAKAGNLVSLEVELVPQPGQSLGINPLDLPTLLTEGGQGLGLKVPSHPLISPTPGTVITSGTVSTAGANGGQVTLTGQQVGVINGLINASGANGGGTVRIGGDYQGQGTIPTARTTLVDQTSHIKADALGKGNGGQVIVWADNTTQFNGIITAKGGRLGGNGGLIETSAKQTLDFSYGRVDAGAYIGKPGNWLLDPNDIFIDSTQANSISSSLNNGTSVTISTTTDCCGVNGNGDIALLSSINKTANNPANLTLNTTRYLTSSPGSVINMASGDLTIGVNQVGSADPTNPTIQNAINAVGNVVGQTTINLGAINYLGTTTYTEPVNINKSLTIAGQGVDKTVISGNNAFRVFNISGTGTTVNLEGLTITQGRPTNSGEKITVQGETLNLGFSGGGIFVANGSTLNLSNSKLSQNSLITGGTEGEGGGGGLLSLGTTNIHNSTFSNNSSAFGGGILNFGTLTATNSTFSQNSAKYGGGIINASTLNVSNSTISGNSAILGGGGLLNNFGAPTIIGGIVIPPGPLVITNSTLSGNSARIGGGVFQNTGSLTVGNSILVGDTASLAGNEVFSTSGLLTSNGYNLVGQNGDAGGFPTISSDLILTGPANTAIAPLGNYGGATQTHALVTGSPAIDADDPSSSLKIDQRGAQRGGLAGGLNAGDRIDIGAFEARVSARKMIH